MTYSTCTMTVNLIVYSSYGIITIVTVAMAAITMTIGVAIVIVAMVRDMLCVRVKLLLW